MGYANGCVWWYGDILPEGVGGYQIFCEDFLPRVWEVGLDGIFIVGVWEGLNVVWVVMKNI